MSVVNNKAICEIISSLINFKTFIVKILKYNRLKGLNMENAGSIGIGVILGLAIKNASAVGKVVKDFSNLEKIAAKTKLGISGLQKN